MTAFDLLNVPMPGPLRLPEVAERLLPNGLRLLAARRGSVPLVEVCLTVPFAHTDPAVALVLAGTIVTGADIEDRLRGMGAGMSAGVDADRLRIAGSALAEQLPAFVELLAELVTRPVYPAEDVVTTRENSVQSTVAMLAEPIHGVLETLNLRMFGDHPYGRPVPRPEAFADVDRDAVLSLHADRVGPTGASLVLTGDIDPEAALDKVEQALGGWPPLGPPVAMQPVPPFVPHPVDILDSPGVTQSLLRMALPAPGHHTPDHPALAMAALVFGGYFSSRLVQNIREDKGFSYSPSCGLLHVQGVSLAIVSVDVVTANTAAALGEVMAELDAMVSRPVTFEELDRARRYAVGTQLLRMATLTGLTSVLCELDLHGLPVEWLRGQAARLASVTPEQVTEAAGRYLAPAKAITVLLCDRTKAF